MPKLARSAALGRLIRLDDLETLGVSTQTLAEEAMARGDWAEARSLVDYFHEEMRIMHGILTTWIRDILRYIVAHAGSVSADAGAATDEKARSDDFSRLAHPRGTALSSTGSGKVATTNGATEVATTNGSVARAVSSGIARMLEAYPIGQASRDRCRDAIAAGDAAAAVDWLERMRLEFKNPHELLVAWIQDLLTFVATTWGEEAVLDSILETHQSIWGDRYAAWDRMTPLEKLALTVEGMRGGHFSGPRRRGDMVLVDEGDRYRMVMAPCGSGGVLRGGDPETGRGPYPVAEGGTSGQPHLWTWQKIGVHWYCAHCCIAMEWLPGRVRGRPLRPLDHVMDPAAPCTWYVYKDEADTRAYHYPRSGLVTPADAPDRGEDWRAEYPGGPGVTIKA